MKRQPVVLFACFGVKAERWLHVLTPLAVAFELRTWPAAGDIGEIDYIITWAPPHGFFTQFVNLKAIFSIGAGVDSLLLDPALPDIPVARMIDESLTVGMAEFVLTQALHYHRAIPTYQQYQAQREWHPVSVPLARERIVGIMGMGELGRATASMVRGAGFKVRGWSRQARPVDGVDTFAGTDQLDAFLNGCMIVVCLLPLTAATHGILNRTLFSRLNGAYLISVGRGPHLVEEDLIPALDAGHLAGATLDAFVTEPLPSDHPFWVDPRIFITPHASALTHATTAGPKIVDNILRAIAGKPLLDVVDRAEGY